MPTIRLALLHRHAAPRAHPWARRLLALLIPGLLAACAASPTQTALKATAQAEIARRPAFYTNGDARAWSVRRDGQERGLLWGTFHIAYSNETVLPPSIRARFYQAADLSVETVLDRIASRMAVLRALVLKANTAVDPKALAALDPAVRQQLDDAVPDPASRKLSLRGLAVLVRAQASRSEPQLVPTIGFVDLNLITFARQQNRTVRGLESPELVDATLDAPNGPDAAAMLAEELRRAPTLREMGEWARAAYGRGEVAQAAAVLAAWQATPADMVRYDTERQALLTERTLAWMRRLKSTLEQPGDHFVAVGAGHLPGEDGLVTLLRAAGYQVLPCPGDVCPP